MQETYLLISEVAQLLKVESHVLRYWEDELGLKIKRNEFGHRCYTQKDIQFLIQVKEWKDKGYPLKAIKSFLFGPSDNLIPMPVYQSQNYASDASASQSTMTSQEAPVSQGTITSQSTAASQGTMTVHTASASTQTTTPMQTSTPIQAAIFPAPPAVHAPANRPTLSPDQKMEQFQSILNRIVSNAIRENNVALGQEVGAHVSERVLKEMDYLMRTQEEVLETHFQNLDQAIRKQQIGKPVKVKPEKVKPQPKAKKEKKHRFSRKESAAQKEAASLKEIKAMQEAAASKE